MLLLVLQNQSSIHCVASVTKLCGSGTYNSDSSDNTPDSPFGARCEVGERCIYYEAGHKGCGQLGQCLSTQCLVKM